MAKKAKHVKNPRQDPGPPEGAGELVDEQLEQISGGTQANAVNRPFKATPEKVEAGGENIR